jgi:potassium efflux system protein
MAAMGVGLGFGLQEIFANFVSGIILLFERPIRVGDVVTLGDKTGAVSRIRMRSTTIVDPDRKEYIVPNKDLITERLLNWTLSDTVNRLEVKVGVAYGSDTDLACRLLCGVANEHPLVLKEPECIATFDRFGDSTLDFTLRCFLPSMEKRLQTIHDLNTAIYRKFAEASLEIAFPQTDVHVRSLPKEWLPRQDRAASNGNGDAKSTAGHGLGEG